MVSLRRELLATPDGDELVLDHLDGPPTSPRAVLLHGLEGSSFSVYLQGMLALLARAGLRATALNFRSCACDHERNLEWLPNRRPRLYHSGETGDLDLVVKTLAGREPDVPLLAAGVSLGGNVLLKWLGENPGQDRVVAAATVSVPFDLAAGARYLETRLGGFYVENFLRTLREKVVDLTRRFPAETGQVDLPRALRARTFFEFDDAATAPLHGFASAQDYYTRSSSVAFLSNVRASVLAISAEDDPFVPPAVLDRVREVASPAIELVRTRRGGHVGFVAGRAPWRAEYWAEARVVEWLVGRVRDAQRR
jgi:predicted alpha/beta-fold hydrolase